MCMYVIVCGMHKFAFVTHKQWRNVAITQVYIDMCTLVRKVRLHKRIIYDYLASFV